MDFAQRNEGKSFPDLRAVLFNNTSNDRYGSRRDFCTADSPAIFRNNERSWKTTPLAGIETFLSAVLVSRDFSHQSPFVSPTLARLGSRPPLQSSILARIARQDSHVCLMSPLSGRVGRLVRPYGPFSLEGMDGSCFDWLSADVCLSDRRRETDKWRGEREREEKRN